MADKSEGTTGPDGGEEQTEAAAEQEAEQEAGVQLPADMFYDYEELRSRPSVSADSDLPEDLLLLSHSFGFDSRRRGNLQLLDENTLMFIAGNLLVLLDVNTREQRYMRSCSGGGIGSITVHPSNEFFAVAEKGTQPDIIVYEYPSLRPYRILRGGTERAYSFLEFDLEGKLLASVGSSPDFMLTLWDWRQEKVTLSCKAMSKEVFRVNFSPYNPGLLTSSGSGHIKFWKMANTFTGLKLQGLVGRFGKTPASDIEGYVDLPDGKVVSGSSWGNMLLWEGSTIKVEICRKGGRRCHNGLVQPFTLEDGQVMTMGSDGAVRAWDFESLDVADSDSSMFEIEPLNEMVVANYVSLYSMVKSCQLDSLVWFAQDSNGAIWKLDLSFTYTAPDPECLFSFHAGPIQAMDVSKISHMMATTALDRSVRVFDFLSKRELTTCRFNQGGTAICWAPPLVNRDGGLLVTGFEDGVVRLLELYDPHKLQVESGPTPKGAAKLQLRQAFKPHNAPVTAVAYKPDGTLLATGSSDDSVFFFTVGETYDPVGFVCVPGPVQALEWSPHSQSENTLLILCQSGHVLEIQSPDPVAQKPANTFELEGLPSRFFRFRSIKSRIRREEEVVRREAEKARKKKEKEEDSDKEEEDEEEEEKEEEELPPIYIPEPPSPICCGFYSQPNQFWLSVGGYDSGFLYHCKFSENQDQGLDQRQDEPFYFLPVQEADDDPISSIAFSSDRQLLFCGMNSGFIRVYPLQPDDPGLTSMQAYWTLSVHDNNYGHLKHIRCSHDDHFVLTAGNDGNIFSFSLLPLEEIKKAVQRKRAKVPAPREGLEKEGLAQDIADTAAYSIETAKQNVEKDRLHRKAQKKIAEKRKKLAELQLKFKQLLSDNEGLPAHVRLKPKELQLHQCFSEQAEKLKAEQMIEVRKQMSWEEERCSLALSKLQDGFDSLKADVVAVVAVVAISTDHRISSYRLPTVTKPSAQLKPQGETDEDTAAASDRRKARGLPGQGSSKLPEEGATAAAATSGGGKKLADRQLERLRKATEKAEQARERIEKRKSEWDRFYAEKPDESYEDPEDIQAILEAKEKIGDLKLKSDKDFTVPVHLRMNTERKRAQLIRLENNIRDNQTEMNGRIITLRDKKVLLVSRLRAQVRQLDNVHRRLPARLRRPPPSLPTMLPEETPEKRMRCSRATLERYQALKEQSALTMEQQEDKGASIVLEQLEKEMEGKEEEEEERGEEDWSASSVEEAKEGPASGLSKLEEELEKEEEIRLLNEQEELLEQMDFSMCQFDAELQLLHHQKLRLDWQLKLADLQQLTLYQEMLLHEEFKKREDSLQEKLNGRIKEEKNLLCKLEESNEELEMMRAEIIKLQEKEKSLVASFQASLGEENKFEEFLTKVFKKKVKRVKKEEKTGDKEEEQDSDEDSDEDDDFDDDYDSDSDEGVLDDNVCPAGCEPDLFENTLQLRERRMDLEELVVEMKKNADNLKKECDALAKKEKALKSTRKVVEDDLEQVYKEKQLKMNELDVVVPLRLNQIEFVVNGSVPSDLSPALVLDRAEVRRLEERIKDLQVENRLQRELYAQARKQHVRLVHERKDKSATIQKLEKNCTELMMMKYGRMVDLEALMTLSGSRAVEELKQENLFREAKYDKELREWDADVEAARDALMEVVRRNTELLHYTQTLFDEKVELEQRLNMKQMNMVQQFQDYTEVEDKEEIQRLQELVNNQGQEAEALRREIYLLTRQGGPVPTPCMDPWSPLTPMTPCPIHSPKQETGSLSQQPKSSKLTQTGR